MERTKEHNLKISHALKGKKKSEVHKKSISISAIIRLSDPEKNPNYRGEKVGYVGIHIWLRKTFGYPIYCCGCKIKGEKKNNKCTIAYALKKGCEYKRKKENFLELCNKCHRNYDKTKQWNEAIARSKRGKKRPGVSQRNKLFKTKLI